MDGQGLVPETKRETRSPRIGSSSVPWLVTKEKEGGLVDGVLVLAHCQLRLRSRFRHTGSRSTFTFTVTSTSDPFNVDLVLLDSLEALGVQCLAWLFLSTSASGCTGSWDTFEDCLACCTPRWEAARAQDHLANPSWPPHVKAIPLQFDAECHKASSGPELNYDVILR